MSSQVKKRKKFEASDNSKRLHSKTDVLYADDEHHQSERFKQTIQWLMEDRNISEAELSRLTNLSPATIHRLIYGITDPRLTTLRAIASFFKIRIEQLIGDYPIPSVTQVSNENADKIFFSTPILIPYINWEHLTIHIDNIGELTMDNWANWHATTKEIQDNAVSDFFATKLSYSAGNLLHAESILIVKSINNFKNTKIGDCVIGSNANGVIFVGQISGSGDEIIIKGSTPISRKKCKLFGIVVRCEIPFSQISKYSHFV